MPQLPFGAWCHVEIRSLGVDPEVERGDLAFRQRRCATDTTSTAACCGGPEQPMLVKMNQTA